jgi:hypothetical protein
MEPGIDRSMAMARGRWGAVWFNLALVLVVLLPAWMVLQYAIATLTMHPGADPHWLGGALAIYVILAAPLIVGGVLQNLILLAIPPGWSPAWRRLTAILSGAVLPLTVLLFAGGHPGYLADRYTAMTFCAALVVYGWLVRLPPGTAIIPSREN